MRACALLLSAAALWFVPTPAKSQTNSGDVATLKGQIDGRYTQGLTVQLYDISRHETFKTSEIRGDGAFEFRGAAPGPYLLTVTSEQGETVYQSSVSVGGPGMPPVIIHLSEGMTGRAASQPLTGAISVRQLQHPPTRKALNAAVRAQRFSAARDYSKAAAALEKAVALSPDYADAHTNLGAMYFRLGRYHDSIAETERSIAIGGATAPKLCNLAFAQLLLADDANALDAARFALKLQPEDPHAHFIVGLVLFLSHGAVDEVKSHLEFAARTLPEARDALRKIASGKLVPRQAP
jgi:tetratricopeptide (TPR) repeat protein